ncbi:CLUMA_CG004650, isoform A, partial [Clunio marinus]
QLPVPYNKTTNGGTTAIPLPATVLVTRRTPDKRSLPVPNGQSGIAKYPSGTPSSENSRPNSPPDFKSGIRFQGNCKIPPSPYNVQGNNGNLSSNEIVQAPQQQQPQQQPNGTTKHSMLDKLKLFNKDKDRSKSHTSKRTSSSSGFSSARSDSSLSLNNDSNLPAPSKGKKNETTTNVKSTSKASKLLSSKSGKEQTSSGLPPPSVIKSSTSKGEKKEKVKSVEINVENPSGSLKLQKGPTVKFQQSPQTMNQHIKQQNQQQQAVRKVEIRTEMKTGLVPPQVQPKAIIQPVTSIPKPMAAIKGTTKQVEFKKDEHFDVIKTDGKVNGEQKMQVVNPLSMSPLHNQLLNQQNGTNTSMSDSIHSTSTNNHSHSNSSESSVIYRPDSGSEFYHSNVPMQHRNPIPNRKLDHFNDPLLTNGHKFNTIPSKMNGHGGSGSQMATTIFEEDKQHGGSTVPLRSIMRNFNNHVTLPTRGSRSGQHLVNGYYEENGQGYCSDGDALRKNPIRYTDVENGYLSEGGGVTNPHFMSIFRNRPQLPTTIEERCRSGKEGNLESPEMDQNNGQCWSHESNQQRMVSSTHSRRNGIPKTRTKGVPQNFGYIKRTNGSSTATEMQTNAMISGGRTAHVSAVPRGNKIKVSGGTQTTNGDFQSKANVQYKSYSLTGQGAAQLSQSVKERFGTGTNSLPKSGLDMHVFHARMANRGATRITDGSLSDTYSDIKDYSSYSMWLKHSNTSSRLSDGGESVDSATIIARNQRLIQHRNSTQSPGLKLNRSNSIRSTKSEKLYPTMLSRGPEIETEPYYCLPVSGSVWSQPTSPTPRSLVGLLSPTHTNHRLIHQKKNDEAHSSQISLMSGGSSMYGSTTEEQRQVNEVRRLKRELTDAREQVMSLSSQLSTNVSREISVYIPIAFLNEILILSCVFVKFSSILTS